MLEDTPATAYAALLLTLLRKNQRLMAAIQRDPESDDAQHYYLDIRFAQAALQAGWERAAIHAVLNDAHIRLMREALPDNYITLILYEAAAHTESGILDGGREALLAHISENWHIDIIQVIRHGKENSLWSLRLLEGIEVKLGTSEDLLKQSKVRAAVFDVTGTVIPQMTGKRSAEWDIYVQRLAAVAITIDTPELPRKGYLLGLLHQYLEQQACVLTRDVSEEDWNVLALQKKPFVSEGGLYVHATSFHQFCHLDAPELTRAALLDLLRHIGGVYIKVSCGGQGAARTSRAYWCIKPLQLLDEEPGPREVLALGMNGTHATQGGERVLAQNPTQNPTHYIENVFNEF